MDVPGASPLRGHLVVFGFQGVGRRIVRQLSATGRHVVVIDPMADPAQQEDLQRWGVTYLAGYGDSQDTLQAAAVADAHAVLCVTDDDVRNIRLALLVRDVSTTVRLVVRMANSSVGRAMHDVVQPGVVLNVAALAAGSFVEAATARTTHTLSFGGQEFAVVTGPDSSGDPDALQVGTLEDLRRRGIEPDVSHEAPRGPRFTSRVRELLSALNDAVDRPFRIAFAVLAGLFVVSIVVLTTTYRKEDGSMMDIVDAIYFTSETIATVGFGDFYFRDQPTWLRLWAVVLILLGAALVAIATALLTNALVSRRLEQSLGRQRLTGMRDHIVVIGLGRVGSAVATGLRQAGYEVAVIDGGDGQRFIPQMRQARIPVLLGDATLPETQKAAGIDRAAGVAVLTSDDLVNIETGLAVRGLIGDRPVPIALRVFSRNLARLVGSELDAGTTRSIAELASPWFVGAALGVDVLGTFYVGARLFIAVRIDVRPGVGLDGAPAQEAAGRTRLVAVERGPGTFLHPVPADTVLRAGDAAYVIGQFDDLLGLLQRA